MPLVPPSFHIGLLIVLGASCHEEPSPQPFPVVQAPPQEAKAAFARARELFAADKPFDALAEVEKAVALAPEWAEVRLALGKLLLSYSDVRFSTATIDRGRLEQAIAQLGLAFELEPRNPETAYWSGRALLKADRTAEAEQRLGAALALKPDHGPALKELGFLRAAEGDAKGSIEYLARASAVLPPDAGIQLQLGLQLEAEERLEEARDAYLTACELNPAHPGPRSALVVLYGRLGDPAAAERMKKEFERCRAFGKRIMAASLYFDEHRREPAACIGLAELYRELGMTAEAINWAERALRLDAEHEPAIELLRKLGNPMKKEGAVMPDGTPLDDLRVIAPGGDASSDEGLR